MLNKRIQVTKRIFYALQTRFLNNKRIVMKIKMSCFKRNVFIISTIEFNQTPRTEKI